MDKAVYLLDNISGIFVLGVVLSIFYMLGSEAYGHRKKGVVYLNNNHRGKHINIILASTVALVLHIGSVVSILIAHDIEIMVALGGKYSAWAVVSGWILFYVALSHIKEERISGSADDLIWKKDAKEMI